MGAGQKKTKYTATGLMHFPKREQLNIYFFNQYLGSKDKSLYYFLRIK